LEALAKAFTTIKLLLANKTCSLAFNIPYQSNLTQQNTKWHENKNKIKKGRNKSNNAKKKFQEFTFALVIH
jgi:hypothetical protein